MFDMYVLDLELHVWNVGGGKGEECPDILKHVKNNLLDPYKQLYLKSFFYFAALYHCRNWHASRLIAIPEHAQTHSSHAWLPPCCPQGPFLIPVCCADLPCAVFNSSTTKLHESLHVFDSLGFLLLRNSVHLLFPSTLQHLLPPSPVCNTSDLHPIDEKQNLRALLFCAFVHVCYISQVSLPFCVDVSSWKTNGNTLMVIQRVKLKVQ